MKRSAGFFLGLLWLACRAGVAQNLHIVATGDTKGYLYEENVEFHKSGGILERQAAVEQIQRQKGKDNVLLFDTGDALGYYYLTTASDGRIMLDYMEAMGYDAMVVGNHDFDVGKDVLKKYADNPDYPAILGANVLTPDSLPFLRPYAIFQKAGLRIGVIGLTDPAIKESVLESKMQGLIVTEPDAAVRAYLDEVRSQADVVILLTHLSEEENTDLAKAFPDVNIIIGKSSYVSPEHFVSTHIADQKETFLFTTDKYGRLLPHIEVEILNRAVKGIKTVEVIELDAQTTFVQEDRKDQLLERVESDYREHCSAAYGLAPGEAILRKTSVDSKELRDFLMTMMMQRTRSEVAILNDRFLDYENYLANAQLSDSFTVRDFERIFWIENDMVTLHLRGDEIAKIMKRSENSRQKAEDRFVHIKAVNADLKSDALTIHGGTFLADQTYKVVTTNFLADGGDGYVEFTKATRVHEDFAGERRLVASDSGEHIPIRKTFLEYLIANKDRSIASNYYHPVWFLTLRKIGFQAENKTKKNEDLYKDHSINELQGEEKVAFSSTIDLKLTRWTKDLIWENYLKSSYGRIKLGDVPYRESEDDWSVESLVAFPTVNKQVTGSMSIYPFSSAKFQSEFTPRQDSRRKDLFINAGMAVSDFWHLSENRVGLVHLTRFSQQESYFGNLGVGVHSLYSAVKGNYGNFSEFEFIYFFSKAHKTTGAPTDSASSNSRSLKFNWSSIIAIEKFRNFYFNPGINFFAYKGFGRKKWAYALSLEFGLIFTTGWKFW